VKVIHTKDRGYGLFAAQVIPAGALIIEYVGEVINMAECAKRLNLLKTSEKKDFYMFKIARDMVIDASRFGNYCRFANHCCDPNAKTELWTVGAQQRLGLFASKDIKLGEEITYDYCCEGFWEKGEEPKCLCGAKNCKGFLGVKREAKPSRTKKTNKVEPKKNPKIASNSLKDEVLLIDISESSETKTTEINNDVKIESIKTVEVNIEKFEEPQPTQEEVNNAMDDI
jgi:histone-lysine N-methyltransferase SETD2